MRFRKGHGSYDVQKHLVHLKTMQQRRAKTPIPADLLNDMFRGAAPFPNDGNESLDWIQRFGSLGDAGLVDEQYALLLQNFVNDGPLDFGLDTSASFLSGPEKRAREDVTEDGRNPKKSRFEVLE